MSSAAAQLPRGDGLRNTAPFRVREPVACDPGDPGETERRQCKGDQRRRPYQPHEALLCPGGGDRHDDARHSDQTTAEQKDCSVGVHAIELARARRTAAENHNHALSPTKAPVGGPGRNRTGIRGFAVRCITTLPPDLMDNGALISSACRSEQVSSTDVSPQLRPTNLRSLPRHPPAIHQSRTLSQHRTDARPCRHAQRNDIPPGEWKDRRRHRCQAGAQIGPAGSVATGDPSATDQTLLGVIRQQPPESRIVVPRTWDRAGAQRQQHLAFLSR